MQVAQPMYVQPVMMQQQVMAPAPWKNIMENEYMACCTEPIDVVTNCACCCLVAGCISEDSNRSCCCGAICYVIGCWSCHRADVQRYLGVPESSCCTNCCVNSWFGCCLMSFTQSKRAIRAFKQYQSTAVAAVPQPMMMQQQPMMVQQQQQPMMVQQQPVYAAPVQEAPPAEMSKLDKLKALKALL